MIDVPKPLFSKWYELSVFQEATGIPTRTMGLYIIAKKKKNFSSEAKARPLDPDIIYIGMTTSSLHSRVGTFIKIALGGKGSHSGGSRTKKVYGVYPKTKAWKKEQLFIAYWDPFGRRKKEKTYQDFINMGRVTFLEYQLLGKFYKKHSGTPELNAKRRGE